MSESEGYDYFEVEADIGVTGWGPTMAEAFRQTGLGVFALMVAPGDIEERVMSEVPAAGENREALLVNWINDCLCLHDIEGFVARRIELPVFEEGRLLSRLWGEPVDPGRHRLGTVVKAATYHQLAVEERPDCCAIRLIVDI